MSKTEETRKAIEGMVDGLNLYFVFCILYFEGDRGDGGRAQLVFCILYFVFCILYFVGDRGDGGRAQLVFCILYFVF